MEKKMEHDMETSAIARYCLGIDCSFSKYGDPNIEPNML